MQFSPKWQSLNKKNLYSSDVAFVIDRVMIVTLLVSLTRKKRSRGYVAGSLYYTPTRM